MSWDSDTAQTMTLERGRIPPGPAEKYDASQDLLSWMNDQFDRFGNIYRASIDEMPRLCPAGSLMTRAALKNDRLGNYFVPAGTEIYISPYLIQRNPAFWEAPDRFNPDRFAANQLRTRPPMRFRSQRVRENALGNLSRESRCRSI
jgi:cytochrome P450